MHKQFFSGLSFFLFIFCFVNQAPAAPSLKPKVPKDSIKGSPITVYSWCQDKPRVFFGNEEIPVFDQNPYIAQIPVDVGDPRKEEFIEILCHEHPSIFQVRLKEYPSRRRKLFIPESKLTYTAPSQKKDHANQKTRDFRKSQTLELALQGKFILPVKGYPKDALFFGDLRELHKKKSVSRYYHRGIDFAVPQGTQILASNSGRVAFAGDLFHRGIVVAIDHGWGIYSEYLHLSKPLVKEGDWVKKGQVIALSGNTGISTGPHLHWHITLHNRIVNPLFWLQFSLDQNKDSVNP